MTNSDQFNSVMLLVQGCERGFNV